MTREPPQLPQIRDPMSGRADVGDDDETVAVLLSAAKSALFVLQIVNQREPGTNESGAIATLEAAIAKAEGRA